MCSAGNGSPQKPPKLRQPCYLSNMRGTNDAPGCKAKKVDCPEMDKGYRNLETRHLPNSRDR